MAKFDPALWAQIAPRLQEFRGEEKVDEFLMRHNLKGLKWWAMEGGRQGVSVESLAKLCEKLDVSPTWLLFGQGRRKLSTINNPNSDHPKKN
jgi:hypothetical protein